VLRPKDSLSYGQDPLQVLTSVDQVPLIAKHQPKAAMDGADLEMVGAQGSVVDG
jgi:hypothetical protein